MKYFVTVKPYMAGGIYKEVSDRYDRIIVDEDQISSLKKDMVNFVKSLENRYNKKIRTRRCSINENYYIDVAGVIENENGYYMLLTVCVTMIRADFSTIK